MQPRLTDQEYAKLLSDVVEEASLDNALKMLTRLYDERVIRAMEHFSGKRSARSVKNLKFITAVNVVQARFSVKVSYTQNNRYEVKGICWRSHGSDSR